MAHDPVIHDPSRQTTVVDVLSAFSDGMVHGDYFASLPPQELRDLVERLTDFYAVWRPPPAQESEIRFSVASRQLLKLAPLYSNSTVVPDPVFDWLVEWVGLEVSLGRQFGNDWTKMLSGAHLEVLTDAVDFLAHWRGLLERGWVIAAPMRFDRFYGFRAALRSREIDPILAQDWEILLDWATTGNALSATERFIVDAGYARFTAMQEATGDKTFARKMKKLASVAPADLGAVVSEYVDGLSLADGAEAKPLASSEAEWEYLMHRLRVAGKALGKEDKTRLSVIPALARSELPFFAHLSPADLESVRSDEQAFHEWQLCLSRAVRSIESLPIHDGFADEANGVLNETLIPAAARVRDATSRSRTLRRAATESAMRLGFGVAAGAGAVQVGLPINYAVGSAGLSSLADLTMRAVFHPSSMDARSVLAQLLRVSK